MRIRACIGAAVLFAVAAPLGAQQTVPEALSLEDALRIARRNNPTYLQAENDKYQADWDVRQAYGQLLPTASASSSVSWQGSGEQQFGTLTLSDLGFGNQPSYYQSSYRVGLTYFLSYGTLLGPSQAKAQRRTTEALIDLSASSLVSQVTTAYLEVLRQQEAVRLAQQQLENSRFNLRLAQGQLEVGQVTPIDVGLAEVQVGRSEVGVLQARNAVETGRMRLLQQMGVSVAQQIELSTSFELSRPSWDLDDLMARARDGNPTLRARNRSQESAEIGVRTAKSAYYPTVSLSTGWSGFTREASNTDFQVAQAQAQVAGAVQNCAATNDLYRRLADPLPPLDCTRFAFTDADRQQIVARNNQFPFSFQRSPPSLSLSVSIPIFQGLSRQRNLEAAKLQRDDFTHQVRGTGDLARGRPLRGRRQRAHRLRERGPRRAQPGPGGPPARVGPRTVPPRRHHVRGTRGVTDGVRAGGPGLHGGGIRLSRHGDQPRGSRGSLPPELTRIRGNPHS